MKRYYMLDIYKIVAAILIVFHHYQQLVKVSFSGINFYGGIFNFGYLVELFFMISGFLFALSENRGGYNGICKKVFRRVKRLYPMAFIACLMELLIAICYYLFFKEWTAERYTNPITIISSFLLLFEGIPGLVRIGLNNPAWYLCVLLQCYLIYYFLNIVFKKNTTKVLAVLIFLLALFKIAGILPAFMGNSSRGYIAFFIGMILYYLKDFLWMKYCAILAMTAGIAIVVFTPGKYYWALVFIFFPILVFFATRIRIKEVPLIDRLSAISFDVYLFHVPVYYALRLLFKCCNILVQHSYLSMFLFYLIVLVVSTIIHYFIEEKINYRLRRL